MARSTNSRWSAARTPNMSGAGIACSSYLGKMPHAKTRSVRPVGRSLSTTKTDRKRDSSVCYIYLATIRRKLVAADELGVDDGAQHNPNYPTMKEGAPW